MEKPVLDKGQCLEDLEKELLAADPNFNPNSCVDWNPITDEKQYPQLKMIWRGDRAFHKPFDTHVNLLFLLNKFGAKLRYNCMTRRREIDIPGLQIFKEDSENNILGQIEYLSTINYLSDKKTDKFLDLLCAENPYHPIGEVIQKSHWDGIKRWDDFVNTIQSTQPDIDKVIIKTWMVAAIASIFTPDGFTHHGVLVLQGMQGIGKTAWVKRLDPINCGAVADGVLLDPKNKDSVINASRFWIVELGELDATLNKTDIAHLKSFITSNADNVRAPYARRETRLPRRSAYIATVNDHNFLVDTTGNRRWWTVEATSIDYDHEFDMVQVWSEVYSAWQKGALTYLPSNLQSTLNEKNKEHERIDPLQERLMEFYDWSNPIRKEMSSSAVLIDIGISNPTQGECTRIGKILTLINGSKPRKSGSVRLHKVPATRNLPNKYTYST